MHEIRHALRVLRRSPGFTAIAIVSLALGIGANTAIFSVSWVLFSQPLAVRNPGSLVAITNRPHAACAASIKSTGAAIAIRRRRSRRSGCGRME
jgi:putative ABC transport system permease protein